MSSLSELLARGWTVEKVVVQLKKEATVGGDVLTSRKTLELDDEALQTLANSNAKDDKAVIRQERQRANAAEAKLNQLRAIRDRRRGGA